MVAAIHAGVSSGQGRLGAVDSPKATAAALIAALLITAVGGLPAPVSAQDMPTGAHTSAQGGAQDTTQGGSTSTDMALRLETLTRAIEAEGDRQWASRVIGGSVTLGAGGLLLLGSVLLYDDCGDGSYLSGLCQVGVVMMGVTGASAALGGMVMLLWKQNNERAAERFVADTRRALSQEALVARGEATLRDMADQARSNRYWRGGTWLAIGTLFGIGSFSGGTQEEGAGTAIASGLITFGLIGGWGVVELLWPDPVERDWGRYQSDLRSHSLSDASLWRRAYIAPVVSPPATPGGFTGLQAGFVFW
jgi:hypothetical protein